MRGNEGDTIVQHGRRVDQRDRVGTIVEVRGPEGPFLVHFEGRARCWIYPGPDTEITAAQGSSRLSTHP